MITAGPGWELRLGDCIKGMRELSDDSVDVTITDPPYEAEAHTLQRRQKGKVTVVGCEQYREVNDAPLTFEPITPKQRLAAAKQIARVTRHSALVFCQVEAVAEWRKAFNATEMPYRRAVPWNKPDAMPSLHGRYPGQSFEAIVLAQKPSARPCPVGGKSVSYTFSRATGMAMAQRKGVSNNAPHPTTKPLALMKAIIEDFTYEDELILDAFAGSATTGVACRQLGRRFIGWELNLDFYEVACRRLRGDEARPNPAQPSLFGGAA